MAQQVMYVLGGIGCGGPMLNNPPTKFKIFLFNLNSLSDVFNMDKLNSVNLVMTL